LKDGNDKLMSEVNSVTRELIAARTDIRRKLTPKLKDLLAEVRKAREEDEAMKKIVKLQLS
jgi:archaellum component FlaC